MNRIDRPIGQRAEDVKDVADHVDSVEREGVDGHGVGMPPRRTAAEFEDPAGARLKGGQPAVAVDDARWRRYQLFATRHCPAVYRAARARADQERSI